MIKKRKEKKPIPPARLNLWSEFGHFCHLKKKPKNAEMMVKFMDAQMFDPEDSFKLVLGKVLLQIYELQDYILKMRVEWATDQVLQDARMNQLEKNSCK